MKTPRKQSTYRTGTFAGSKGLQLVEKNFHPETVIRKFDPVSNPLDIRLNAVFLTTLRTQFIIFFSTAKRNKIPTIFYQKIYVQNFEEYQKLQLTDNDDNLPAHTRI